MSPHTLTCVLLSNRLKHFITFIYMSLTHYQIIVTLNLLITQLLVSSVQCFYSLLHAYLSYLLLHNKLYQNLAQNDIYYLTVGQECRNGLGGSLTRQKSMCWLSLHYSKSLLWKDPLPSSLTWLLAEFISPMDCWPETSCGSLPHGHLHRASPSKQVHKRAKNSASKKECQQEGHHNSIT